MKQLEKNIYIRKVYKLCTAVKKEEGMIAPKITNTLMAKRGKGDSNKNKKKLKVDDASKSSAPSTSQSTSAQVFNCLFCDNKHKSTECCTYVTIE